MGFRINRAILNVQNPNERKGQRDTNSDSSQKQQHGSQPDNQEQGAAKNEVETITLRGLNSVIGRANEAFSQSQNKGLHYELKKIDEEYFVVLMSPENIEIRKLTLHDFLEHMGQSKSSGVNRGNVFDRKY